MWYQKDWFTGIDYYNLKEKQVHITEMEIKKPVEQRFHEQTEIYYVISGDAELWINGEKIFEFSKIEMKVTANREDVQLGIDVDSKITGLKGEGSYTVKKVYTRAKEILENWKKGMDVRAEVIAKLADPDAVGGQIERWACDNVWHNEIPVVNWEKGGIIEEEVSIGFTPSDLQNLDAVA